MLTGSNPFIDNAEATSRDRSRSPGNFLPRRSPRSAVGRESHHIGPCFSGNRIRAVRGRLSMLDSIKWRQIPSESNYSGFDSGLYRILDAKWHFSQENATLHHLQMTTFESKPL
jgi:hypothetical protein